MENAETGWFINFYGIKFIKITIIGINDLWKIRAEEDIREDFCLLEDLDVTSQFSKMWCTALLHCNPLTQTY